MTGLRRTMGFVFALAALQAPLWAANLDEVTDTFKQGVDQWQRGHEKEALEKFRQVLAGAPSQEAAYALWTDPEIGFSVWRELLAAGGEYELVAKRVIELARVARKARANDQAAIAALVAQITSAGDAQARWPAIQKLSNDHGEYGAAYLINFLSSGMSDSDKRAAASYALIRMSTDVVIPLCAALASDDAVLRGNLCLVLGTIKDPRASGYLAWMAANDPDASVKEHATRALEGAGWSGTDPLNAFLAMGEQYHQRRMRDDEYSDVVWSWDGSKLVAKPIPRAIYNDELAKLAFDTALIANPASTDALAGLARSYVAQAAKLERMEKAGVDLGDWKSKIDEARLARNAAGVPALDTALGWCVKSNDSSTGAALCQVLGSLCKEPTAALQAAMASSDGAMRSEAALAIATIGLRKGAAPSPAVVGMLGEAVGRDVVRLAFVVDSNAERGKALQAGLEQMGIFVSRWESGAHALAMVRRAAGLDVLLASDVQKDVTLAEIIDEMKAEGGGLANVPVIVVAETAEAAQLYGDRIQGSVQSVENLEAVSAALSKDLDGDRALADDLARRAGELLAHVAHGGHDVSSTVGALQGVLENRKDEVVVPALAALGSAGGATQVPALIDVVANDARSEGVRTAAANALSGILGRNSSAVGAEGATRLQGVAGSSAPVAVRDAAARALGLLEMDAAQRVEFLRKLRTGSTNAGQ